MSLHCPNEKRLNILDQQLIDRDILLHRPDLIRKPFILLEDQPGLWALNPVQNFRERSIGLRYMIGLSEALQECLELILQAAKALEDCDPGLIDRDELVERHPFDGFSLLHDVLSKQIALSGFTGEDMGQLIERDRRIHDRQPAHPWAKSKARSLLPHLPWVEDAQSTASVSTCFMRASPTARPLTSYVPLSRARLMRSTCSARSGFG